MGSSILEDIDGVSIKSIVSIDDKRGWLIEIYREDEDNIKPIMSYISYTKYGIVRGPHEHSEQSDFFVFVGPGDFELYLWDNRVASKTYNNKNKIVVGETNKVKIIVPPGVVHGYKSISSNGGVCINMPDELYIGMNKKEKVDEIRYENQKDSMFVIT